MSESLCCAKFDISFSWFCRKSVQSWKRRFWAKKCRRDHLRSLWRSVVPVTVRRWQHREAAKGRWGSLTSVGLRRLWRSVLQVCPEDQRSDPSTQIPRVEVFWNDDPRQTVVPMTVRHTCRRGEWRKQQKKFHQVWDDGVYDSPLWPRRSVAWSVDPAVFWQISSNKNPCVIRFLFFINSSKNLIFWG